MKRFAFSHQAIDIAGHLSVVLGWIKALDWYSDKPNFFKKILLGKLQKKVRNILPTLQESSQATIAEYAHLTRENSQDFVLIRQKSNELAQMLVQEIAIHIEAEEKIVVVLSELFGKAGELIAIADHLIDLEKDQQHNQYNPIVQQSTQKQTPLAQEYVALKTDYYALKYQIMMLLPQTNATFAEAFKRSLHNLDKQIDKNLPACMRSEDAQQWVGKMQIVQTSFSQMPQVVPPSSCCNEACLGACATACCQICAQGCCDDLCDSCCSGDNCCSNNGSGSTRAERQARREERQAEREAKRKEREERRKDKGKKTEDKKKDKDDDDDTY
jgi:hypothetical protein